MGLVSKALYLLFLAYCLFVVFTIVGLWFPEECVVTSKKCLHPVLDTSSGRFDLQCFTTEAQRPNIIQLLRTSAPFWTRQVSSTGGLEEDVTIPLFENTRK